MKDSSGYKCLLNYLSSVLISSIKSALNISSLFQDLVTSQQILHDAVIEQGSVMLVLPLKIENTFNVRYSMRGARRENYKSNSI